MYDAKINLIGCDETSVPPAARQVLRRWAAKDDDARLLVIQIDSADDVSDLKRLNTLYPRYPIVAVLDAGGNPALVAKCKRAGALQVVQMPVLPDDLQVALDCIAARNEERSKLATIVAVTGSVGGCGGTTVAINLAYELARQEKARCILMELSLRKGVLANHLDIAPRYTTTDLVADIQRVDGIVLEGALTEIANNFSVLAGPYETIQTDKVDLDATMQLVELTRHLASWLVLDVPSTYDELFYRSLMTADRIVLVADQTVAALRGVQMVCASLGQRYPLVVINRYNDKLGGLSADRIREFLPRCEICTLAKDEAVVESMNKGLPLRMHARRSPVLADIDGLLKKLETGDQTTRSGKTDDSIPSRLSRALTLS